jgi:hypothetical protein
MTDSDSDVTRVVSGMGGPSIAYRRFGSVSAAPLAPQDAASVPGEAGLPAPSGSAAAMFSLLGAALPEAAEIGVSAAAPPVPPVVEAPPPVAPAAPPPAALRPVPVPVAPPSPIPTAPPVAAAPPEAPPPASLFPARVPASAPLAPGARLSLGDMFRVLSDRSSGAATPGNPFPFRRR